jgi:phage-related protein
MKTHKFADYKGDPWAEALAEQADDMKDDTFVEKARRDGYLIKSFTPYVSSEEGNDFVNDVVRSITPEDKEEILGQDEIAALMQGMNVYSKNTDKFRFVSIGINDSEGAELYEGDHLWCKYYVNNTEDQFLTMFNLPALTSFTAVAEVMRHSLRKVKVQGEVNKLLSMRGLYLKSCEFGSTYFLLSKKGLENKLDSYQAQAYRRKESQMRLSEGITKHKSKWEKLSLEEITIVSQSVFDFDKINNA